MFGFYVPSSIETAPGRVVATFIPLHDLDAAQRIEVTTKGELRRLMTALSDQREHGIAHREGFPISDVQGEAFVVDHRAMLHASHEGRLRMLEIDDSKVEGGMPLKDAQPVRAIGRVDGERISVFAAVAASSPIRDAEPSF